MHYQPQHDEHLLTEPTAGEPSGPAAAGVRRSGGLAMRVARALSGALTAAQARFRRARGGSVLIIVVALLVLIALAGTALIVRARTDRFATRQNLANTQIEMLVDGVIRLSKAQL